LKPTARFSKYTRLTSFILSTIPVTILIEKILTLERVMMVERQQLRLFSRISIIGFILAILAGLAAALAGFGSRWNLWSFRNGFVILRWAAYAGIAAAAISFVGSLLTRRRTSRRGLIPSILGLVLGILVFVTPWSYYRTARQVPAIHDISTDTENPPRFISILPLRRNAPNPAEYGGPAIAVQQKAAYPDIVSLIFSVSPDQAFNRALGTARSLGWQIVDANRGDGRIEATDTTFWFGFKDDIVIRIIPSDHGSRIDVRSVSRVGRSDLGTNAKRIRMYLKKLKRNG
jgi:uncharacterized protein (DUF1499 family)